MDMLSELKFIRNILCGGGESETTGNFFVLPVNGPIMRLYFTTEYGPDENIPKGTLVSIPKKKQKIIIILNEGNCDILYEVNALPADGYLASILRAQEDVQVESRRFSHDIFSVFIQAVTPTGPNLNNAIGVGSTNGPNWGGDLTTAHVRVELRA